MVGRKRKNTNREPNGRAQRTRDIDPNAIAQLMPHRRLVPANVAHDPRAECIVGRLCLNGWISEIYYQAAIRYRETVARYRMVIDAPRQDEISMSGIIVGPWGASREMPEDEAIRRRSAYMAAYEALEGDGGHKAAREVAHCVIYNRQPYTIPGVKRGLKALAVHYGLTKP